MIHKGGGVEKVQISVHMVNVIQSKKWVGPYSEKDVFQIIMQNFSEYNYGQST